MTEVVVLEMNAVYYCILIVSLLSKQTIQAVVVTITSSYYSAFYSEVQFLKVTNCPIFLEIGFIFKSYLAHSLESNSL